MWLHMHMRILLPFGLVYFVQLAAATSHYYVHCVLDGLYMRLLAVRGKNDYVLASNK